MCYRRLVESSAVSRRAFLGVAAFLQPVRPRPNILLLLGDNWAYPHAGVYGDPVVRTPVFDRMAAEGVVFTHAFAPNPSCSPSRSSLLSGQETHRLGEAASLYGPLAADVPIYTDVLTNAGYFTGFSDKGFGPGTSPRPGRTPNPAGAVFDDFDAFLAARPKDKPFCFWFGSHDPHVPWNRGQERRKALRADLVRVPPHLPDHPTVRGDILDYYCEVQQFDSDCGRLLAALERSGELDNTLVIMTSDNGWQIPRGLANCHDLGVRIPLAMRLPGRIARGQQREDFVSIADLAPTILDAAGVARPSTMNAATLFGPTRREAIFLERERHANVRRGNLSYPVRGIRTESYLYLRNLEPDRWPAGDPEFYWAVGPYGDIDDSPTKRLLMKEKPQPYFDLCFGKRAAEELYDLRKDPGQVHNVAADPAYASVRRDLAGRVDTWMKSTADPRAAGATDYWDRAPYSGPKFKGAPVDLNGDRPRPR
jgi:N-sulfoglucosamine sulfohydrolase